VSVKPFVLIAAGLFVLFGVPDVSQFAKWLPVAVVKPVEVDACVLVYEKDSTAIEPAVRAALNTLNRKGVLSTLFEDDTVSGDGDVPEQYRLPLEAARKAGLPCLVVMAGGKVLRVVTNPTAEQIAEVAK
jgi:hypothetical protein